MFDCPEENTHRGEDDIAAVVSTLLRLSYRNFKIFQKKFCYLQNILAGIPGIDVPTGGDGNPYMEGQKLPVAAKKGMF